MRRVAALHLLLVSVVIATVAVVATPAGAGTTPAWTVVANHLDSPHGIAFTADGAAIVTESGHLGRTCPFGDPPCFGLNAQISSIDPTTGERTPLVTGLLSLGFLPFEVFGLGGVSVDGSRISVVTALNPRFIAQVSRACTTARCSNAMATIKSQAGLLLDVDPTGGYTVASHVGASDYRWVVENDPSPGNPDFAPGDADPYGVLGTADGVYVADGGSNTLSVVDDTGVNTVLAYVPDPPNHRPLYDAVATCVADANGTIYVGTLTGSLYRWQNGALEQVLHGGTLRAVVGCTSDANGNLYLVNLTQRFRSFNPEPGTGSVVKVAPDLSTSYVVAPDQGLNYPNGIAVGPDDALYLTANSLCPADPRPAYAFGVSRDACPRGGGTVLRLAP
jgi:sugar lactone lactonase YvrE